MPAAFWQRNGPSIQFLSENVTHSHALECLKVTMARHPGQLRVVMHENRRDRGPLGNRQRERLTTLGARHARLKRLLGASESRRIRRPRVCGIQLVRERDDVQQRRQGVYVAAAIAQHGQCEVVFE